MKKHLSILMLLAALVVPWASQAQEIVTIGNTSSTTTQYTLPVNMYYNYSLTQQIYTASEIGMAGTISSIAFEYTYSSAFSMSDVKLYMKNVSKNEFTSTTDMVQVSNSDLVWTGTLSATAAGWVTINLDTPFEYDGASNLLVCCYDATSGLSGISYKWRTTATTLNLGIAYYSDSAIPSVTDVSTTSASKSRYKYRNNVRLGITQVELSCYPVRNLAVSEITGESMTLTWLDTSNSSATYTVYRITATDTTVEESGISDTSYTVEDLAPTTDYTFAVAADCGAGDVSSMRYVSGTTACMAIATDSLPYHYGFDDATATTAAGTFNVCYGRFHEGTTTNYPYASSTNHSGGKSLYMYSTAAIHSWITLPLFEEDLNELQLSFYAYRSTTATYGHYMVGVMSNPEDISTFDTLLVGQVSANSTWELVEVPLNNYTGNGNYLAILCPKGSATNYTYIDDITVDYLPACTRPTDLEPISLTAHSALLGWMSEASEFIVEYGPAGFIDGTGDSMVVYTNSVELLGLQMGKTYKYNVTAVCGSDTSTTATATFTTGCVALTANDLPYLETFESYTSGSANPINACWTKAGFGTTTYPYPYSTAAINGNMGLYFYSIKTSSSEYGSYVALPPIDETLTMSDLQVEFNVKRGTSVNSTSTATYSCRIMVGIADSLGFASAADIESMVTWIDTLNYSDQPASSVHAAEVPFGDYTGEGRYVVFYVPAPAVATSSNYTTVYLDDVNLMYIPSCFKPVSASIEAVATDEVSLSWVPDERTDNPSGGWVIEYGPEGFASGEGEMEYSTDTTVTITDLTSATRYEFRIKADCGGYVSDARSIAVTTNCEDLALPYYENFDGMASLSAGDGTAMVGDAPICWNTAGPNGSFLALYSSSNYLYGGTGYSLKTRSGTANTPVYVILPVFEEEISALEMSFQTRPEGISASAGAFEVGYLTNSADTSSFVVVQHYDYSDFSGAYQSRVATFDNAPAGSRIAMRHIPVSVSYYWFIDEIDVHMGPSCSRAQSIAIESYTDTSAVLVINDSNHVDNYIITLFRGATDTVGTVVTTTDETYTFTGLTASSDYRVTVVTDCGDGTYTAAHSELFTTACSPMPADSLPYVETFEAYGSSSSSPINPCWTKGTNSATAYPYPYSTAASGTRSLYFYGSHSTTASYWSYAALPAFTTPVNQLKVNFQLRRYSTASTTYPSKISVGVMTNPGDISTFELVEEIDNNGAAASSVHEFEVSFAGYTGQGRYMAFYVPAPDMVGTTETYNYIYLDSVVVDLLPSCYRPVDVVASNITGNSMDLSWVGNANNYEVQYDDNDDFANATTVNVNTNAASITGLTTYHAYFFRVRGICDAGDTSEWSYPLRAITELDCGTDGINIVDTIGDGTSNGYTYTFHGYTTYRTGYSSHIFTAQELTELGLLSNSRINGISLHSGSTGGVIRKARIYVTETSLDEFSSTAANDTVDRNTMTLVYSGDLNVPANSWVEIPFNTPFQYSGMSNLLITLARDTNTSASVTFYYTNATPNYRTCYGYRSTASAANNTATRSYYRSNIVFNMCTEIPSCMRPSGVAIVSYDDTSATLTWDNVGSDYEVLVSTTSVDPDLVDSPTLLSTDTNGITITDLAPNTDYYVYVRTNCGAYGVSEWSIEQSFHTQCTPQVLPYTETFEAYATGAAGSISACWTKGTNSTTAYPHVNNTAAYLIGGQRFLYFYAYRPSSTTTAPTYSYAALPAFQDSVKNLGISFYVRRHNSTSANYTTYLVIGVMTNPDDISTFFPMDTLDLYNEQPGSLHGYEYFFNNYTGDGRYIAILNGDLPLYGTQTTCYSHAYVDDITVDYIPTCQRVNNITVDNVTSSTATVHWAASQTTGATYEVQYGEVGFQLGFGTTVTTAEDSVMITGLEGGTDYDVYVRAICSATDQSDWSFVQSFSTLCAPRSLPMVFDPDNYATGTSAPLPTCWTRINNATGTSNYYPYINSSSSNAHTGTNIIYYYFATSSGYPTDEAMVFPEVDTVNYPMNTVEIIFWAKRSTNAMSIMVGVMTNPNDINTFTAVDTIPLTNTSSEYTVQFDNYAGYGSYVALRGVHTGSSAQYIYLDDITIRQMSPCPRAYDLTVTAATATTATLQWADTIGSTQWMLQYSAYGDTATTVVPANSNPFTLIGLAPTTFYTYRVAPICSDGTQADWSAEAYLFSTTQVPATIPYSYDFEDASEWDNWQTASNANARWYRGQKDNADTSNNVMYQSVDGGATNSWVPGTIVNSLAWRDIDFGADTHSYDLSFYYRGGGCNEGNYDGVSILVVDPSIPVLSVPSTSLGTPWGNVTTVHARRDTVGDTYMAHLDNMSGVKRVVFDFFQSTTASHTYTMMPPIVDSISVAMPECERPFNLTLDIATTNTITLHWTGDDSATYVLDYRPAGTTGTDLFDTVFNTTSHTITGLNAATEYNIWVRKVCSDSLESSWSSNITVSTLCGAVSAADTLRENFESYTGTAYNAVGPLPTCWQGWHTGSNAYTPHVTNGSTYSYCISGTNAITLSGNGSSSGTPNYGEAYLRLYDIAEPTNTLTLAYWLCTESSTTGALSVGYLTGDDFETDFVALKTIYASSATVHATGVNGLQTNAGIFDTVRFDSIPDGHFPIVFKWISTTNTLYSASIDDIAVWSNAPACAHPENVVASGITHNSATLSWTGNAESYEVAIVAGEWVEPNAGTAVANATVSYNNLIPGTAYNFGVRAVCGDALVSDWEVISFVTDVLPCYVPTNLAVSDVTYTSAQATFTPGEGQTEWALHLMGQGVDRYDTVNAATATIGGLVHGNSYQLAVRALCGNDESAWSDTVAFSTLSCDVVQNVTVSDVTGTTARISWTATGAASYIVSYGYQGSSQNEGTTITVSTNSVVLTGLDSETSYDVYVRSVCADGVMSVWSSVTNFVTTAGSGPEPTYYTITVLSNNNDWGTVSGGGSFLENTTTTISATPNQGYRFVQWQDGNTDNPRTITVTADMTYTATFADGVGIDQVTLDEVSLFPNPATSTVTVRANGMEQVSIIDLNGRTVMTQRVNTESATFDLSTLAKGTYFVRIVGEQASAVRKLVVK